ncbi:MAG: pyruvate, phosphate dikinase [Acidimicrobiia bacterium]
MPFVYSFDHQHDTPPTQLKEILGGKGADLAEMTSVLELPVPPGFTITTEACRAYLAARAWPAGLDDEITDQLARLEATMGRRLGDPNDPLLISVRSGAMMSMPGMMDTVLNLGLNDESVAGLAKQTGDERFAYDSYRRFIAMFGRVVLGVDGSRFDELFDAARDLAGVSSDAAIPAELLRYLTDAYRRLIAEETGQPFPQEPREQLNVAIRAVFASWTGARAVAYRTREHIPHDLGTAVSVQAMVFGNRDDNSGTGVGFTRDPATGEKGAYGDFLVNAQGEDVVAGVRATLPLSALADRFPAIYEELLQTFARLERHYRDMLDTEFTIEQGKLWMLQTRVGKRTGRAALRMAVDMTTDPDIRLARREAVMRVTPAHLEHLLHPQFEQGPRSVIAKGLPASPGAGVGRVYFEADDVVAAVQRDEKAILVRNETSPEDVHGMQLAKAVLTTRGGLVSHAAVIARGWGIPAVVGADDVKIDKHSFTANGATVREGEWISVDGSSGDVMLGQLSLTAADPPPEFSIVLGWADDIRRGHLGVRANADNGPDAARAREYGAEGIGLCRTEHMFLGDRLPVVQRMILADTPEKERQALAELLEVQRSDFEEILDAMDGLPVTVRLLDPPLHEFLPDIDDLIARDARGELDELSRELFTAARSWREQNPMLGTRGVRLGILKPLLYKMQVRALVEAARHRAAAGGTPIVEIMIPLIVTKAELALVRRWVEEEVASALAGSAHPIDVKIGTMIETPRAAVRGDDIAEVADFFSFGTNDLTQMVFGFSRDDVEGRLMARYLEEGLLPRNPFETIDHRGVGDLVRTCVERARGVKPDLQMGVCGEHGGDPQSIALFAELGLDYVSCSPFRVPIARLAAAQATLGAFVS